MAIIDSADGTKVVKYVEPSPFSGQSPAQDTQEPGHYELFGLAIATGWSDMAMTIQGERAATPALTRWRALFGLTVSGALLATAAMGWVTTDIIRSFWALLAVGGAGLFVVSILDTRRTTCGETTH